MTVAERAGAAEAERAALVALAAPTAPKVPLSWNAFKNTKWYDILAAAPLIAWYAASAWQRVPAYVRELRDADLTKVDVRFVLSVLAQGASLVLILAVLGFLLLRGPARARTPGFVPRLTAVLGTYLGLGVVLLPYRDPGPIVNAVSLLLVIGGLSFAVYALAHLGRSFSIMAEARKLVTDGPYAAIRHPLYAGEGVATIGLMLQYFSPLALAIVVLQLAFQALRVRNEERILRREFSGYRGYMARTARFIPGVY